jgi:hypothetical protein
LKAVLPPHGIRQGTQAHDEAHSARRADGGKSLLLRRRKAIGADADLTVSGDLPHHPSVPADL